VLWLDVPMTKKNCLTFGRDPIPDTDSRSLFYFPHHCKIEHFRRFINISYTVADRLSRNSMKWLTPATEWIHYILRAIGVYLDPDLSANLDHFWLRQHKFEGSGVIGVGGGVRCHIALYTVSQKKLDSFSFEHNFGKYCQILIILSL